MALRIKKKINNKKIILFINNKTVQILFDKTINDQVNRSYLYEYSDVS